ncbi:MAG: ATP-binding protein [Promethearchaeota archaeon]|nr:MAG: ATP-binding protein [Candidatus Lokiarchaeota archaeon]
MSEIQEKKGIDSIEKFEDIAHVILIEENNSENQDFFDNLQDEETIINHLKKHQSIFPEIKAFLEIWEREKLKSLEKIDFKIYLVFFENNQNLMINLKTCFNILGFDNEIIYLDIDTDISKEDKADYAQFRKEMLDINTEHEEMYVNITSCNIKICEYVLKISKEIDLLIYLLTNEGRLIFLPERIESKPSSLGSYEDVLLDNLEFAELQEGRVIDYNLEPETLMTTFKITRKVEKDTLIIKKRKERHDEYDFIKIFKIKGLKIGKNDPFPEEPDFLSKVFEGLYHSRNNIIRLLLNDGQGIEIYLGVKVTEDRIEDGREKINLRLKIFQNHFKSILPGLEMIQVKNKELEKICKFILSNYYYGCFIGHPEPVNLSILKSLENALAKNCWGMMSIAEPLSSITINKTLKILKVELEPLINELQMSLISLRKSFEKHRSVDPMARSLKKRRKKLQLSIKLDMLIQHFEKMKILGGWDTCHYLFSEDKMTYNTIYSLLKSNYKSLEPVWITPKVMRLNAYLAQFAKCFQLIDVSRQEPSIAPAFRLYRTIYSSNELGQFIFIPPYSLTNFTISRVPNFKTKFPARLKKKIKTPIDIGKIKNSLSEERFLIDANSLVRHCLVIGSTGSGKTNTIFNIILNIRKIEKNFPFLIIDPAKTEYRHLKNRIEGLEVYTAGRTINPLKINIFEVPQFLTYSQWVNELINIFETSFPIPDLFRNLLLTALNNIYRVNGWTEKKRGRTPSLRDFINFVKLEIDCIGYIKLREEYKGMVNIRFGSLLRGTRAISFDTVSSRPSIEEILKKPIILELAGLLNDDEKAIIFNTILKKLYHYLQHEGFQQNLKHLLIIEEAHRLLKYEMKHPDAYLQTSKARTQDQFGDILSEIRAFGEGIILVDQKPRQLIPSAITNTNLKICHKLPSLFQINTFKDSMGLLDEHLPFVTKLQPGECVLKIDQVDIPFFIKPDLIKTDEWGINIKYSDEMLRNEYSTQPRAKSIEFKIMGEKEHEFNIIISEIIYSELDDETEKTLYDPSKEECLKFFNIEQKLWVRLKEFYRDYAYCSKCIQFKPLQGDKKSCPVCSFELINPGKVYSPQLDILYQGDVIARNSELDEIYASQKEMKHGPFPGKPSDDLIDIRNRYSDLMSKLEEN